MKKYVVPILVLIVGVFTWFYSCSGKTGDSNNSIQKEKPNIILLMGDDHGWEETGYNRHPFIKTPVLDEMAQNGLVLDRFYSAHPSCSPTRGSIITGRHPNRYATFSPGWSIRPEEISIAQLLKNAGYTTGHFGKWHLGPIKAGSPTNPGAMGFDTWVSHDNFFEMNPVLSRNGATPEQIEGEGSQVIIDETISFISESNDKPFFAVVWFGSPHEPYEALPEDLELYKNLPDSLSDKLVRLTSLETGLQVKRVMDSVLQERFAEITAMDRAIGKLRDYLEKKGVKDNTLIWYCGDNGIPPSGLYNSQLHGLKGTVYEGGTRVPGIIEWPEKISDYKYSDVNAVTTDMLPTLCELVGEPLPERPLDGISLMPLILDNMEERSSPICFWDFDRNHLDNDDPYIDEELQQGTTPLVKAMGGIYTRNFKNYHHTEIVEEDFLGSRAILDNTYKLVITKREGSEVKELYNIIEDPGENKDLIETYPEIAGKLENKLIDWQHSVLNSLTEKDYNTGTNKN